MYIFSVNRTVFRWHIFAYNKTIDGKYVQGSTKPTVKNRVPTEGSYYAFTAPADGTFYVKVGLGGGKTSYICNNKVYNEKQKDLIFEGAYKLEAGKTYYIYSVTSALSPSVPPETKANLKAFILEVTEYI